MERRKNNVDMEKLPTRIYKFPSTPIEVAVRELEAYNNVYYPWTESALMASDRLMRSLRRLWDRTEQPLEMAYLGESKTSRFQT